MHRCNLSSQNLVRGLQADKLGAQLALKAAYDEAEVPEEKARLAIVAAHLGFPQLLEQISAMDEVPDLRTVLVHLLPKFHGAVNEIDQMLASDVSSSTKFALGVALALFDPTECSNEQQLRIVNQLDELQQSTPDSGVQAAARLAMKRWGQQPTLKNVSQSDYPWSDFDPELRLVRIPAGSQILGRTNPDVQHDDNRPHLVTLTRPYWMADREISVGQYRQFIEDPTYPDELKPVDNQRWQPDLLTSPTNSHPVQRISWYDAAMFCNWLSHRNGKQPRYEFLQTKRDDHEIAAILNDEFQVQIDLEADGFHLPSEAQWEMACRAGSETDFYFGNDFELFRHYGTFSSARQMATAPCGSLLPNRFGVFEMHGNVWEWCEDWRQPLGTQPLLDPRGPDEPHPDYPGRVFRGGGVATMSGEPISGARGYAAPYRHFSNVGFRVALPEFATE